MKINKISIVVLVAIIGFILSACGTDADVASRNISAQADNFEITRRIVFYNGITGEYIFVIEGLCSLGNYDSKGSVSVTCKTSPTEYKKHFLGLSDNVTYFAEQVDSSLVDVYHYKVIFKPSVIIPDVEVK